MNFTSAWTRRSSRWRSGSAHTRSCEFISSGRLAGCPCRTRIELCASHLMWPSVAFSSRSTVTALADRGKLCTRARRRLGLTLLLPDVVRGCRHPTWCARERKSGSQLTRWWRGESAANSSLGKIQGISPIRGLAAPGRPRKRTRNQFLTRQFPTHPNREFFEALQGI